MGLLGGSRYDASDLYLGGLPTSLTLPSTFGVDEWTYACRARRFREKNRGNVAP